MTPQLLNPVYVGEIIAQPFSFARTTAELSGVAITGATLEIEDNADCIEDVEAFSFEPVDGAPGATWKFEAIEVGTVTGVIWLALSDGERVAVPWQLEVRGP